MRLNQGEPQICSDLIAVEEPLEIRLDYKGPDGRQQKSISITMRTPGHDYELAAGFLFTEGLIQSVNQIEKISHCGPAQAHLGHSNIVKVTLADEVTLDLDRLQRHFYTSSSCGVCGKSSIEALRSQSVFPKSVSTIQVKPTLIQSLPYKLREAQAVFDSTGGLHASALFDSSGNLVTLREDVGRHNALDKVLGFSLSEMPLTETILMLSGRISFELVQKAVMARIPIIAAVGAPSSLAVDLAESEDVTLIGFLRGERFNIYTGSQRILTGSHTL
ncbi:MAG: formate dehydrogenase accessory sulfurtransferase FdhD [Bdellovibrionota bacterium]